LMTESLQFTLCDPLTFPSSLSPPRPARPLRREISFIFIFTFTV
jgi:hypothetical protein